MRLRVEIILLFGIVVSLAVFPVFVLATNECETDADCEQFQICVDPVGEDKKCVIGVRNPLSSSDANQLVSTITTFVSGVIGALAIVMLVWGGILFLTSAGNEQRLATAKRLVIWALVGLFIAISATPIKNLITTIIGPAP